MSFDSQKNSSSSNSTTNETVSKPITLQDSGGAIISANDIKAGGAVTITDGGAIQAIKESSLAFLDQQNKANGQFLTFANEASKSAMSFAATLSNPDQATTKWLLMAAVGAVAIWAFARKGA